MYIHEVTDTPSIFKLIRKTESLERNVRVILGSWKNYIQIQRDSADVLRQIIKNVSKRLVCTISSPTPVTDSKLFSQSKDFF